MKKHGYLLLCEGCVWELKAYEEFKSADEEPWKPCPQKTIASFPQYDTAEDARAAGSLVASEQYDKEYAALWWHRLFRKLKLVRYGQLPNRLEVHTFEIDVKT